MLRGKKIFQTVTALSIWTCSKTSNRNASKLLCSYY